MNCSTEWVVECGRMQSVVGGMGLGGGREEELEREGGMCLGVEVLGKVLHQSGRNDVMKSDERMRVC